MPSQPTGILDIDNALLEGVDHRHVAHLIRAFDIMAQQLHGVSNSTALWALATLLAKIMAACALNPELMDATGKRFSDMLKTAYPAMVRSLEIAQRKENGRPSFDA